MLPRSPRYASLFPYTTLLRSGLDVPAGLAGRRRGERDRGDGARRRHLDPAVAVAERHVGPLLEARSEEHTSELQSLTKLVCRLLLEKKKRQNGARQAPLHTTE